MPLLVERTMICAWLCAAWCIRQVLRGGWPHSECRTLAQPLKTGSRLSRERILLYVRAAQTSSLMCAPEPYGSQSFPYASFSHATHVGIIDLRVEVHTRPRVLDHTHSASRFLLDIDWLKEVSCLSN
jgi:hypothetical protein